MRRQTLLPLVCLVLLAAACKTLPDDIPRPPPVHALAPAETGPLAQVEHKTRARIGARDSGFLLLDQNREALRWRLALIDSAVSSLDLQYYLWYGDASGRLLLDAVLRAADRGVQVRLLLDDLLFFGKDEGLATIDAHPQVEVRLFNPWRERRSPGGRMVEFVSKMDRLNTRMHNKLMVADGRLAICGGRNQGDHYFGLGEKYNFHDVDLLAVGPVVRKLSNAFDVFWNNETNVAGSALDEKGPARLEAGRARLRAQIVEDPRLDDFAKEHSDWSERLEALPSTLRVGSGDPVYDRPDDDGAPDQGSADALSRALLDAKKEILVENAYWIPRESAIESLTEFTRRGLRIRVVTNSLASHDVPAVNSGYKKWRRPILESGTELYELRHDAAVKQIQDTPPVESEFLGLHAKVFVVDDAIVYVGSHNLDPRSRDINTELGVLVKSPGLAADLTRLIERDMRGANSWRVSLDEDGDLVWEADDVRVTRQPARSGWQRFQDGVMGILPLDDQL